MSADPLPVTRAAWLDDADEERLWLIRGLWARAGVGLIGGAPKSCKSWLGLDMALSVAGGGPCLGTFAVDDPGGVLVYFAEDASSVVRARLDGMCARRGLDLRTLPIDVITAPTLRLDTDRDQDRLAETVRHHRPRMLLLDPFVRLHRIDENKAGEVASLLAYLRGLQREHDLAVVVVHHARKNGPAGGQAGQGLRGSGDFHAWGDSNLYLARRGDAVVLTIEHRAAPVPTPLALALESDAAGVGPQLAVVDGAADPAAASGRAVRSHAANLDAAVLAALARASGPLLRSMLRVELRVRNESLGDALTRLAQAGRVVRCGERWGLPESAVPVPEP